MTTSATNCEMTTRARLQAHSVGDASIDRSDDLVAGGLHPEVPPLVECPDLRRHPLIERPDLPSLSALRAVAPGRSCDVGVASLRHQALADWAGGGTVWGGPHKKSSWRSSTNDARTRSPRSQPSLPGAGVRPSDVRAAARSHSPADVVAATTWRAVNCLHQVDAVNSERHLGAADDLAVATVDA
jgi:hypothetical protein